MSYKKTIGLGLLLTFALLACAAEEQTNATPETSVQETSDGGQDVANTDQSSSTASATTAPAEKQSTVTTEQPKERNGEQD